MKKNKCLAFTGGGTAGHIFPGLAVIELLKKDWTGRIFWLGSRNKQEQKWITDYGIPCYPIHAGKLRRYFSFKNFTDIFTILLGFMQSLWYLIKERPLLLFSKGGYVSIPPVFAARLLGISVFTHESDFDPGLATRLNARVATKILTSFPDTGSYLGPQFQARVTYTGNPIRASFTQGTAGLGKKLVHCPPDTPLILVLGGSQGALRINQFILIILDELTKESFLVHQMGPEKFEFQEKKNYWPVPFLREELPHLLAAASLVISRAGANTLAELAALGKPALLIPLSLAGSRGDQIRNAQYYAEHGAAEVFDEQAGSPQELLDIIRNLLNNKEKLQQMQADMQKLGMPHAQRLICDLIYAELKKHGEEYSK
jgi:UDP-N-acetylglucosamine--N-acetylmuramyl-(pentapeptide) pyrophosphoryl-undecaprenol N-acetylglucosamine transferase